MTKKYFSEIEIARRFAKKKEDSKVMATSSVWQQKDKRRTHKNYVVKY